MPTVIAYIVVAFVAAPVLEDMGISTIVSHFFVFYYAILAAVTPPVAGAAMVACKIADAGYLKTSWESFKLVGPFYLFPYFMIKNPIMLSEAQPVVPAIMALIAMMVALGSMICFFQKYCLTALNGIEQILFLISGLLSILYGFYGEYTFFVLSLMLALGLLGFQWKRRPHPETLPYPC